MASIAEMLVGSTIQQAQKAPDITGAVESGAKLAQTAEQIKMQRQQMEDRKQEVQMQKANSIVDTIKIAAQSKDRNLRNFMLKKVVPGKVAALGMDKFFTPETLEMLQSSDEVQKKVLGLQLQLDQQVRSGEITGAEAYQRAQSVLSNPEELAMLDTDQIFEAQKFSASEEGKGFRAQMVAEAAMAKQRDTQESTAKVTLARNTANRYDDYLAGGGKSGMESSLRLLEDAAKSLETGQVTTGGITTKIPGFRSDAVQSEINPKLLEARTQAQAALNTVLRATLGAQFTEKEGERLLNQVWDDKLAPAVNARKIRAKIRELRENLKNSEKAFVKAGLMTEEAAQEKKKTTFKDISPAAQKVAIELYMKQKNVSEKEARKALGAD
jgi:NACalpha-BTF3-like transcription factor